MKHIRNNHRIKGARRILIVDNMDTNILLLTAIVKRGGYQPLTATNGFEALAITQRELPDLILLDIMMPEINGYEVCQRLKADPKTGHIPIIFITALRERAEIDKAFNCGGSDFLRKPFHAEDVLARVDVQLRLSGERMRLQNENDRLKWLLSKETSLEGIIPICMCCKRIRKKDTDPYQQDSWEVIEKYISDRSQAEFSHGYCPECADKVFEHFDLKKDAV